MPNQSFLFYFLHAATMGGRGVCAAQTCTAARSACKTAHIGTTRPTPRSKRLRRCAFLTCAVVQPSTLRLQAALGPGGSPLQARKRYLCAMLAPSPPKAAVASPRRARPFSSGRWISIPSPAEKKNAHRSWALKSRLSRGTPASSSSRLSRTYAA